MIQADRDLFARLLVIREKREVSIKDFMNHSLGPAIWSLATPIGTFYMLGKENQSGQSNTSSCSKSVQRDVSSLSVTNRFSEIYLIMF